jgi:peptide/nickel transport system ATP-binding protein
MSHPQVPLLQVDDLIVQFPVRGGGPFGLARRWIKAVNGISLTLAPGETLGIVGESGSGKSTFGRAILGLNAATSGRVRFMGEDVGLGGSGKWKRLQHQTAMIFQDPFNALNPNMTVGETLAEVLRVHHKVERAKDVEAVAALLRRVGLGPEFAGRRRSMLSGGECQRVGIARALAVDPCLIVADECVAALDMSLKGQIINLLIEMKAGGDLSLIFIAHDLSIVRRLCDRVAVMYLGRIVEEGPAERVFESPRHPYTAMLKRALPTLDPSTAVPDDPIRAEPPSSLHLPAGCPFHPRCPVIQPVCRSDPAPMLRRDAGHAWACVHNPQSRFPTAA